jgi:hypothetical protein
MDVEGLTFSPDGTQLAVLSSAAIQVWDLPLIRQQLAVMNLDWDQSLPSNSTAKVAGK